MNKNITYHENGNIFEEIFYKDGRKDGINAYASGDALTFTALDSICIQYNLTK